MINQIELFDQYINGELSGTKLTDFEHELANDEAFLQAFRMHKALVLATKEHGKNYERIADLHKNVKQHKKNRRRNIRVLSVAAASILLLAVAFFVFDNAEPSIKQLLAENNIAPPMITEMGIHKVDSLGMKTAYKNGDYPKAISLYEQFSEPPIKWHLPMAFAYQKAGNFPEALSLLNHLITENYASAEQAKWQKALIYVELKDWQNAKNSFQTILAKQNTKPAIRKKAKQFLKAIKKEN